MVWNECVVWALIKGAGQTVGRKDTRESPQDDQIPVDEGVRKHKSRLTDG